MNTMLHNFRYALRTLRNSPGFTAAALLTLALGIGANTAIFSVVDSLLVRPLPVPRPDRLALVGQHRPTGEPDLEFNYPLFKDYQRQNTVFDELCATADAVVGLGTGGGGATERLDALLVSGNYFRMLGLDAAVGRTFAPSEGVEIDDATVVVLGHGLWQRAFGADPGVVGRKVTVNGHPFTVIGVAPRHFAGTTRGAVPDLYVPITAFGLLNTERPGGEHPLATRFFTWHRIIGRLRDGVTHEQARAAMNLTSSQIRAVTPANTPLELVVLPGAKGFTQGLRDARLPLNLLLATSALVLLIACANLANLQLARATGRTRDFAIRVALGARRGRLVRELLTESLVLAVVGGALGVLVAVWMSGTLHKMFPSDAEAAAGGLDGRVLAFTLLVSVATGVAFGLAPAWRASRPRVVPELKSGGGTTESRVGTWNLRGALVTFQVALSLLVLVGAGLCLRSLRKLQAIDPGFEPSRVVVMSFELGLNHYTVPAAEAFYERMLERVRALPGVEAASLTNRAPLGGGSGSISIARLDGYEKRPGEVPVARMNVVSPDYFRTLGVKFLGGRDLRTSDTAAAPKVMVVNEAFVRRFWGGQDPVGRMVYLHGPGGETPVEVVGVVGSMRSQNLAQEPSPTMFFSGAQQYPMPQHYVQGKTLAVRTGLEPGATIAMLREVSRSFDENVPAFNVRTLAEQKDQSLSLQRMAATLLGAFGALALLLAALGIYGVLAYAVRRRTREIGIRMALGAQVADVLRLVLRQGVVLTAAGLVVGLAGAVAGTRLLGGFLYDVKPLDPLTFAAVVALLACTALLACWLPARRAAKVDPMVAVRYE
jgi:predicted permease